MGKVVEDQVYAKSKPFPKVEILYKYPMSKFPGYSMVGLKVTMAPGGATPPHRHGGATVTGVVLSGHTYNKMNDQPTYLLGPGETFHEHPGCHHKTSMNASDTEELVLLPTMVVETKVVDEEGLAGLVIIDEEWRD